MTTYLYRIRYLNRLLLVFILIRNCILIFDSFYILHNQYYNLWKKYYFFKKNVSQKCLYWNSLNEECKLKV